MDSEMLYSCFLKAIILSLVSGWTSAAAAPPENSTEQTPATFARFVPERSDDFAWENDWIAFRTYGPALRAGAEDSGFDAWLKRVPYPIINRWYGGHAKGISYHADHGEGYDPYHVGSSRGCGGLALWVDGQMVTSDTFVSHRVVEQSRERTVFELDYEYPSPSGQVPVKETKRVTIQLGEPFFRCDATFSRDGNPLAGQPVAIGITTHQGKAKATFDPESRWMSCWEVIDGSGLGTGVVLAERFAAEAKEIPSTGPDTGHALLITQTDAEGVVSYHAGYGWEKAGQFTTSADWQKSLENR